MSLKWGSRNRTPEHIIVLKLIKIMNPYIEFECGITGMKVCYLPAIQPELYDCDWLTLMRILLESAAPDEF